MKLLVYGSERSGEYDYRVGRALEFWLRHDPELFLVLPFEQGLCAAAWRWANRNGVPVQKWTSDVFEHDKTAGYERNKSMVRAGLDAAILFDGGYWHKDLAELCRRHGVPVYRKRTKLGTRVPKKARK